MNVRPKEKILSLSVRMKGSHSHKCSVMSSSLLGLENGGLVARLSLINDDSYLFFIGSCFFFRAEFKRVQIDCFSQASKRNTD